MSFSILKHFAVLSESGKGWRKEFNYVKWDFNGRITCNYEIREWAPDHEKAGKGITLSEDEITILFASLKTLVSKKSEKENNTIDMAEDLLEF